MKRKLCNSVSMTSGEVVVNSSGVKYYFFSAVMSEQENVNNKKRMLSELHLHIQQHSIVFLYL